MLAVVAPVLFVFAAAFALTVIGHMLADYRPMIVASIAGRPLPRTCPARQRQRTRERSVERRGTVMLLPSRPAPVRAAA